ncbi:MAG: hypothetical protein DIKNOCCD_03204 [bacterium]|nr:hypothetical protein [bacterium]
MAAAMVFSGPVPLIYQGPLGVSIIAPSIMYPVFSGIGGIPGIEEASMVPGTLTSLMGYLSPLISSTTALDLGSDPSGWLNWPIQRSMLS